MANNNVAVKLYGEDGWFTVLNADKVNKTYTVMRITKNGAIDLRTTTFDEIVDWKKF